jgi:hypothetical protein
MSHFFKTDSPCVEKTATTLGINVRLPNGYIIMSTHTALLDLPTLPLAARQAHLFPDLSNSALLSISQVCDHGFEARFNSKTVRIMHDDTVIFAGLVRLLHWPLANLPTTKHLAAHYIPLVPQLDYQPTANNVHELTVKLDIVTYLHRACFSPVPSSWLKAIDAGHFATWPGLTIDLVRKHLAKSVATSKDHMRQERQHLRSTQTSSLPLPHSKEANITTNETPEIGGTHNNATSNEQTHCVFMKPIAVTGQIHSATKPFVTP